MNKNSYLSEQLENTMIYAKSTKPKTLGSLLAQQIANNQSIDLAHGVELIPKPGLEIYFSGDIIIKTKKKAHKKEKKQCEGNII